MQHICCDNAYIKNAMINFDMKLKNPSYFFLLQRLQKTRCGMTCKKYRKKNLSGSTCDIFYAQMGEGVNNPSVGLKSKVRKAYLIIVTSQFFCHSIYIRK